MSQISKVAVDATVSPARRDPGLGIALFVLVALTLANVASFAGVGDTVVAVVATVAIALVVRDLELDPTERLVGWAVALYLAIVASGVLYAEEPTVVVDAFRGRLTAVLLGVLCFLLVRQHHSAAPAARGVVVGALVLGGLGSLSAFDIAAGAWTRQVEDRLGSVYHDPNFLAQVLAAAIAGCFAVAALDRGWVRMLGLLGLVGSTISLILADSRGGYLAVAIGLAAVAALTRGKLVRVVIVAVLIGGLALVSLGTIGERFGSLTEAAGEADLEESDLSAAGRLRHLFVGYHVVLDHPALGVGAGNYKEHYREYSRELDDADGRRIGRSTHSLPIETVSEHGLLGATALAILLMAPIGAAWRSTRRCRWGPQSAAAVALTSAVCAWLTASLFLHQAHPDVLWVLLGAVLGTRAIVNAQAMT